MKKKKWKKWNFGYIMTKNDPMVEKIWKKTFFGYIYEKYWSGKKMFVHKVEEREKCYFFFFYTNL